VGRHDSRKIESLIQTGGSLEPVPNVISLVKAKEFSLPNWQGNGGMQYEYRSAEVYSPF
jgi:hypothetical protein